MSKPNYDSYCGIYCGACDIMMADKTGHKDSFASFWTEPVLRAFQQTMGNTALEPEALKVKCLGCKSDTLFINCKTCKIRSCAIQKKVDHCIDCAEYPCAFVNGMKKSEAILPHLKNSRPNMEMIKKAGVDQWLAAQEQYWKCPECKTSVAWYADKCSACGKKLIGLTYKFSTLKAMIVKLGIRLSALRKPGAQKSLS